MNFQEFRFWRDRVVAAHDPLRLDCMNPVKALAHLAPPPSEGVASAEEALMAWRRLLAPWGDPAATLGTTGVRPALRALFTHLAASDHELWLPQDVYPEYGNMAQATGLTCRTFVTLPQPDLAPLVSARRQAALLVPSPLAPLGRPLAIHEIAYLREWLAVDSERRLLFDTVYHFDNSLGAEVRSFWEGAQTFVVYSLAKSWLLPDTLGVVLAPQAETASLRLLLAQPAPNAAARAVSALTEFPDLPRKVAAALQRQWAALSGRVRSVCPEWAPPPSGYFCVVDCPFEELLREHHLLAVPASVFGSRCDNLSVLSCLYYPA